ncbi:helix-turn-helix domain-containing protein [Virgibacillus chiguensis]|uniref:Helix-turn-helix n=1 Tax=Virgibacillus chiguensis TaxID=411959 RepID=A0A1M5VHI2_9BACI|nr:helix-turn-helix transcriptional regulator [Virgibacillus chiguensis]SHH74638.1 Helix-turn-helix [Virgibacillus chiguensis]
MKYGDRLKKLREVNNLSQQQLADKFNINRSTYARYELNQTQPDFEILKKLADFYEVTVDYILGHETQKNDITYFKNKIAEEFPDIDLMFKDMESLTAEDMKEVYEYIKFKKSQKNNSNG